MTVLKLTKSGKAVHIICDRNAEPGTTYQVPVFQIQQLITKNYRLNFINTTRLPFKASLDRFPDSPLWDPNGVSQAVEDAAKKAPQTKDDPYSSKSLKNKETKKKTVDKKIDW